MYKQLLVGIGMIGLGALLVASPATAASQAQRGQPIQLAKDDTKAPAAEQTPAKKKHKHSKKHHGTATEAAPPAAK